MRPASHGRNGLRASVISKRTRGGSPMTKGPAPLALSALLALCLLSALPVHAQFFALSGTVADSQGTLLPGVTVTLGTPTPLVAVTDAFGSFSFAGVPVGHYGLRAELEGFAVWEGSWTANVGNNTTFEITLEALSWESEAMGSKAEEPLEDRRESAMGEYRFYDYEAPAASAEEPQAAPTAAEPPLSPPVLVEAEPPTMAAAPPPPPP